MAKPVRARTFTTSMRPATGGIDVTPNTKSCGRAPKVPTKRLRCCAVPASERAVKTRRLGVPEQVRDFGNRERGVGEIQFCRPLPCVIAESIEGTSRLRQPTLQRAWSSNEAPRDGIDAHIAGRHLSGKRVPHF